MKLNATNDNQSQFFEHPQVVIEQNRFYSRNVFFFYFFYDSAPPDPLALCVAVWQEIRGAHQLIGHGEWTDIVNYTLYFGLQNHM